MMMMICTVFMYKMEITVLLYHRALGTSFSILNVKMLSKKYITRSLRSLLPLILIWQWAIVHKRLMTGICTEPFSQV